MSMAKSKGPVVALTDQERFPLLTDLSYLSQLRQDELAPKFNFQSGDRLYAQHLDKVKAYAEQIRSQPSFGNQSKLPPWLNEFVKNCVDTVSFYQGRYYQWNDQPTIRRSDLASMPWRFVSSDCDLNDMLVYKTSGTSGEAMDILFDPVSQACWLPQLESVLDRHGIQFSKNPGKVAIALISSQQSMLTYASLSTYLNGGGLLKLNLNPAEWSDPSNRNAYLQKHNPEILTGDPFSFLELLSLKPKISPKAMISSAMRLTDSVRIQLKEYFKCPVFDIYSLTECKMIAVAESESLHRAIRPDLYLEVFDSKEDKLLPEGERGELVITGGNNPFLPLIRYRTGDFCSLIYKDGIPYLKDLEARSPIPFYNSNRHLVTTVDISRTMNQFALAGYELKQLKDYSVSFTGWWIDEIEEDSLRKALKNLFGEVLIDVKLIVAQYKSNNSKPVTYESEFEL